MRPLALTVLAASLLAAGGAVAQTVEEAALCRSLTNVLIPRLEDSVVQLNAENVRVEQLEEVDARLELMRQMRVVTDEYIATNPHDFTEQEIGFVIMGGDVILGARNPIAINERIAECRMLFGL